MFNLIGFGEHAGSGVPDIFKIVLANANTICYDEIAEKLMFYFINGGKQ